MPLFIPKKMKVKEQSVLWSPTQYPRQKEVPVVKYMLKVCNLASHVPFVPVVLYIPHLLRFPLAVQVGSHIIYFSGINPKPHERA